MRTHARTHAEREREREREGERGRDRQGEGTTQTLLYRRGSCLKAVSFFNLSPFSLPVQRVNQAINEQCLYLCYLERKSIIQHNIISFFVIKKPTIDQVDNEMFVYYLLNRILMSVSDLFLVSVTGFAKVISFLCQMSQIDDSLTHSLTHSLTLDAGIQINTESM